MKFGYRFVPCPLKRNAIQLDLKNCYTLNQLHQSEESDKTYLMVP